MGMILTGPINIERVANLMSNITRAFYAREGFTSDVNTELIFWQPELIRSPPKGMLESDTDLNRLYQLAIKNGYWGPILASPKEFAITIQSSCSYNSNRRNHIRSRIINLSSLEDLISGQIVPDPIQRYIISSDGNNYGDTYDSGSGRNLRGYSWDYMTSFIEYRNQVILQSQQRLNQSVSKAAFNLVNDLHG